jgi:acyl-CoA thioester hydrolase
METRNATEVRFHVRYSETDQMGIVHHASYVVYLEEARSDFIRQRGNSYAELERQGLYLAVSEVHIKYLKAAHYDELIRIRCEVERVRSRSLDFSYSVYCEATGELLATARTSHICIDKDGVVASIPVAWRQLIG